MNPCVWAANRRCEAWRDRLVTPAEFEAIREKAVPQMQVIMDLLRLTGQRVSDVLKLRVSDLGDEGIFFRQRKTGARLIVRWTLDLRAAVERAKTLRGNVSPDAVPQPHGRYAGLRDHPGQMGARMRAFRRPGCPAVPTCARWRSRPPRRRCSTRRRSPATRPRP